MVKSYLMAVLASCSAALGLHSLIRRIQSLSSSTRTILSCLIPFSAVASATALNLLLMALWRVPWRNRCPPGQIHATRQLDTWQRTKGRHTRKPRPQQNGCCYRQAISRVVNCIPTMAMTPLVYYRLQKNQDPASTTEDSSASEFGSHLVYLYRQPAFLTCCISPASVDQGCPLGGEISRSTSRRWNSGI